MLRHWFFKSRTVSLFETFKKFYPTDLTVPEIHKEGIVIGRKKEDYQRIFQITYVHSLQFEKSIYFKKIYRSCEKALKRKEITPEQQWLGIYYKEEILQAKKPSVVVRFIEEDIGYGVFCLQDIKRGDFIGEYVGLLRKRRKRKDQKNSYCFEYLIGETQKTPFTIDAQDMGNFTRFMNHSFSGNCDPMLIFHGGIMKVILYANQDIQKGSQITYHYGPDYWEEREDPREDLMANSFPAKG